jgi:hypothetical protein
VGNKDGENRRFESIIDFAFWQERKNKHLHQVVIELRPWRIFMVG